MKIKIAISITLLLFQYSINGQVQSLLDIHNKADSLVKNYWGVDNFNKFIELDKEASQYHAFNNNWDKSSSFNHPLDFNPNVFRYKYKVNHPIFDILEYPIQFLLDSLGKLMVGFNPKGLIKFKDLDSIKTTSNKEAITIANNTKLFIKGRKLETELVWYASDESPFWSGYVWIVKSFYNKPQYEGCYRYDFDAILIDLLTGNIVEKRIRKR